MGLKFQVRLNGQSGDVFSHAVPAWTERAHLGSTRGGLARRLFKSIRILSPEACFCGAATLPLIANQPSTAAKSVLAGVGLAAGSPVVTPCPTQSRSRRRCSPLRPRRVHCTG